MKHEYSSYPLEWLDLLITVTLNPTKTNVRAITNEQFSNILNRLPEENLRLQKLIKIQIFSLTKEYKIALIIKHYHSSLIALLNQTLENQKKETSQKAILKKVYKLLLSNIDELLSFIETRFAGYLSPEEKVPETYLSVTRKELRKKIDKIKSKYEDELDTNLCMDIVLKRLYRFTDTTCLRYQVAFRDIFYKKDLLRGLEEIDWNLKNTKAFSPIDKLLIYLNFNSKTYINLLTERISQCINSCDNSIERMDRLLYYYKAFNQLHRKPNVVLNPKYHNLDTVLGNWFTQEILYLEKKLHLSVVPLQGKKENPANKQSTTKEKQKVLCMLSTDQMGLILRASDELRILVAKSMSQVFKTIVPHLSSPYKEDLSYDGMRSKSYVAEERDKQIAIETLERIIKKIKEY